MCAHHGGLYGTFLENKETVNHLSVDFPHHEHAHKNPNAGFSLIEVMVIVGVMAILAAGLASMTANTNKEIRNLRAQTSQKSLRQLILSAVSNPLYLQATVNANPGSQFAICATGGAGLQCTTRPIRDGGAVTDLGSPIAIVSPGGAAITGTAAAPLYYSKTSQLCGLAGPTAACPVAVWTSFYTSCDGVLWNDGVACAIGVPASQIGIKYYIMNYSDGANPLTSAVQLECNDPNNAVAPAPAGLTCYTAGAGIVYAITQIPFTGAIPGQVQNHQVVWSSSTLPAAASIEMNTATNSVATCSATNAGMMQNVLNAGVPTGAIQVCSNRVASGWGWVTVTSGTGAGGTLASNLTGQVGNAAGNVATLAKSLPVLPGMYLCPAIPGANAAVCGGMPTCYGQIQSANLCCTNTAKATQCWGSNVLGNPVCALSWTTCAPLY